MQHREPDVARKQQEQDVAANLEPLDAVHIVASGNADAKGFRLQLPRMSPELAIETIREEALRWTYRLRSRKRWVADRRARERNEAQARDALAGIGIKADELALLGASSVLVVRIPWDGEERIHWESRVFPWEYVLSAATRQRRLERSVNGRTPQMTVMRELQRQRKEVDSPDVVVEQPCAQAPSALRPPKVLFVECVPSELSRQWVVSDERDRLAQVLPEGTTWVVLQHPTPKNLLDAVRHHGPTLIHFAGLDSHQGVRELRLYFGANAKVDVDTARVWLANLGGKPEPVVEAIRERLADDVIGDPQLMLDGVLLRNDDGLPLLVRAHDLAQLLALAKRPAWLATFNLWNTSARVAPLVVAEGVAAAALGFQDAFDDSLADFVHATLYRLLVEKAWNLPQAFIETWAQVRRLPESVDATGITLWTGAPVLPLRSAPKQRQSPPRRSQDLIRCSVKPYNELNYAVLHNAQPMFEKFVLECDRPNSGRIVDVEVEVHMGSETASFQRRVVMDGTRVALTREVHVPLTAQVVRAVHECINSSIAVRVKTKDRLIYNDTHRLRLLPVDQWRDNRRDGRWLPSFVQPRDPAVQCAIEQAQRYNRVLRDDPNAGFEGYQAALPDDEESLRGVDRQVEAVWATLLHDWRLGYINPPPAYSSSLDSQRLRTPSMLFDHRSGTCIDLALMFASCLELIDIYPVIFLLEGHALPGWWRHPDFRDEYAAMSDSRLADVVKADELENSVASAQVVSWHTGKASHAEIKRWIRQRKLVPIETVRLTENCGFVEAIEAGVEALAQRSDFDSMLELVTARYEQVTPLPMLKELP
jgi:hypothetical protein